MGLKKKSSSIPKKKSGFVKLHKDSLAQKIFNITYKHLHFSRIQPGRIQENNARRYSKLSTHEPLALESLIDNEELSEK